MDSDVPTVNYPDLPPFPDDVPTAPLLRLSLQKLVSGDAQESARLWKACTELGFFYLDLRGAKGTVSKSNGTTAKGHVHTNGDSSAQSSNGDNGYTIDGDAYWEDAAQLFAIQEKFFGLPVEEKTKYDLIDEGSYFGYKASRTRDQLFVSSAVTDTAQGYGNGIIDKAGTRDRNEFYNVPIQVSHPSSCPTPLTSLHRSQKMTSWASPPVSARQPSSIPTARSSTTSSPAPTPSSPSC